jgi:hypothetical protein
VLALALIVTRGVSAKHKGFDPQQVAYDLLEKAMLRGDELPMRIAEPCPPIPDGKVGK